MTKIFSESAVSDENAVSNLIGLATGFSAYTQVDPVILADVAGDLSVDSGDEGVFEYFVQGYAPSQIPVPPTTSTAAVVSFAASGNETFRYNGQNDQASLTYAVANATAPTQAGDLQNYLDTVPGLNSDTVNLYSEGDLTLTYGDGTPPPPLEFTFDTDAAEFQTYLATIPGLNSDTVTFSSTSSVTFSYNGVSASSSFTNSSATTPGAFQIYLAAITGLNASGSVQVTGSNGGPYQVTINAAGGANLLTLPSGSSVATIRPAASVIGNAGGPFTVNFANGIAGNDSLQTADGDDGSTEPWIVNQSVSVVGPNGGPFVVSFAPGLIGASVLTAASGTAGASVWSVAFNRNALSVATASLPLTVLLANPGNQANDVGDKVYVQLAGTQNTSGSPTYSIDSVKTLPPGLSLSSAGVISGTLAQPGTYSVEAYANVSIASTTFSWTVNPLGTDEGGGKAGALSYFAVSAPATALTGSPIDFTVEALDAFGNVDTSFTGNTNGTILLTTSDPLATFSGANVTHSGGHYVGTLTNGVGTFEAFINTGGNQTIGATSQITGVLGTGLSAPITARGLTVTSFTPTGTGFTAIFSKPFVRGDVYLYNSNITTTDDVTMTYVNNGTTYKVYGTLLIDPTNTSITFKATSADLQELNILAHSGDLNYRSVVLPDATYTVTFLGGSGSNGFLDALGASLDGADTGGGTNFVTTFSTHFQADQTPVLGIPDFARGPDSYSGGNVVNGGVPTIQIPNNSGSGIPITLYNAANVTDVTFSFTYNPSLLANVGAYGGAGSNATDVNTSNLVLLTSAPGVATFHYTDTLAKTATSDNPLVLGDITAIVPSSGSTNALSLYQAEELLQLGNIVINNGALKGAISSNGIHVNAYFGDVDGNKIVNGLDKLAIDKVAQGQATGFNFYVQTDPHILADYVQLDPTIVGDVAGDGTIDAGDTSALDAFVAQLPQEMIPFPPTMLASSNAHYVNPTSISYWIPPQSAPYQLLLASPGNQEAEPGEGMSLQLAGSSNTSDTLTYSANGLPPGLSVSSSGYISGSIPQNAMPDMYSVTATVTDSISGATSNQEFNFSVGGSANSATATVPVVVLSDPGSTTLGTTGFDALQINAKSLRFGLVNGSVSTSATNGELEAWTAVPSDGLTDELASFNLQASGMLQSTSAFTTAGAAVLLTGTMDGIPFAAAGSFAVPSNTELAPAEAVNNKSNEPGTKFFVIDTTGDQVYRYGGDGSSQGGFPVPGLIKPTGIASSASGDKVWVLDAGSSPGGATNVTEVATANDTPVISWTATDHAQSNLLNPVGIVSWVNATNNNTDLWILDAGNGTSPRILYYQGGGSKTTASSLAATSSFTLATADSHPTDFTTNGTDIWVTDVTPGQPSTIYVYTVSGTALGSWLADVDNVHPTGITLDPSGGNDLWVVDSVSHTVYRYANGQTFTTGYHAYTDEFPLASSNSDPEGIADPVIYPPNVTVLEPTTNNSLPGTVLIAGQTTPNTATNDPVNQVTINGTTVNAVDAAGDFFGQVNLGVGQEQFTVTATDSSGTSASQTVTLSGEASPPGNAIDFSWLSDVTGSFTATYGRTSWNNATDMLYTDLAATNTGTVNVDAPVVVGIENISLSGVSVQDFDGMTPGGMPYFVLSGQNAAQTLTQYESTSTRSVAFFDPQSKAFTYSLVFLGHLNRPPVFASVPVTQVVIGQNYAYQPSATDPENNTVTYSLLSGPSGMTVSSTGQVSWPYVAPTTGTQGSGAVAVSTATVNLLAVDGRGGSVEQTYVLSVVAQPNISLHFTSQPVIAVYVNAQYSYTAIATGGNSLQYSATEVPDIYFAVNTTAGNGIVTWTPTDDELGLHTVTLQVTDSDDKSALQTFKIDVLPIPIGPQTGTLTGSILNDPSGSLALGSAGSTNHAVEPNGAVTLSNNVATVTVNGNLADNTNNSNGEEFIGVPGEDGYFTYLNASGHETSVNIDPMLWFPDGTTSVLSHNVLGTPTLIDNNTAAESSGNYSSNLAVTAVTQLSGTTVSTTFTFTDTSATSNLNGMTFIFYAASDPLRGIFSATTKFTGSLATGDLKLYQYETPNVVSLDGQAGSGAILDRFGADVDSDFGNALIRDEFQDPASGWGLSSDGANFMHGGTAGLALPFSLSGHSASLIVNYDGLDTGVAIPTAEREVYIDSDHNGQFDTGEPFTHTDSNGNYTFSGLAPGTYTVNEIPLSNWIITGPAARSYTVSLAGEQLVGGLNFTNEYVGNSPPQMDPLVDYTGDHAIEAGDSLSFLATAQDPGQTLTFSAVGTLPSGASLSSTGQFVWNTSASEGPHTYRITLKVSDGQSTPLTDTRSFLVTVTGGSGTYQTSALQFSSAVPTTQAYVGQHWTYTAVASDANSDALTYDAPIHPTGMSVDPTTGLVAWEPTGDQAGSTFDVLLRVQDGLGGVAFLEEFHVPVALINHAPVIHSNPRLYAVLPNATTHQTYPYTYQVDATDADGDTLTYSLLQSPGGMQIDPASGALTWTPGSTPYIDGDSVPAVVQVSDGLAPVVQKFTLTTVANPPDSVPLLITSTPRTIIGLGQYYAYQVETNDPFSDNLTYSIDADPNYANSAPPGDPTHPTAPTGLWQDADFPNLWFWTPTASEVGNTYHAKLTVTNSATGEVASQLIPISVSDQPQNHPPQINSAPVEVAAVGDAYMYRATATDADNDPVIWSIVNGPGGIDVDSLTGIVTWTPLSYQTGTVKVKLMAQDRYGGSDVQEYPITVTGAISPPVITSEPPPEVTANHIYVYAVRASDADGNPLTYSVTSYSNDQSLVNAMNPTTGLLVWTAPDYSSTTTYYVTVTVDDGHGGVTSQQFDLIITTDPVLLPPVIEPQSPPMTVVAGQAYPDYTVKVRDPSGGSPSFALGSAAPSWMTINPTSGILSSTSSAIVGGPYPIPVVVTDSGGSAKETFYLYVKSALPQTVTLPTQTIPDGLTFHFNVPREVPTGDPFNYALIAGDPTDMTINSTTGVMTWPNTVIAESTLLVEVAEHDLYGTTVTVSFDLQVLPDNQAPTVQLWMSTYVAKLNDQVSFLVAATDNVGVAGLSLKVNGTFISLDGNGRATLNVRQAGELQVVASAGDASGNMGYATATLGVYDPGNITWPNVNITTPANNGTTVNDPIDIEGTVSETGHTVTYIVTVIPFDGSPSVVIGRGGAVTSTGTLAHFDPSLLPDGSYTIEVTATDDQGNVTTADRLLAIVSDLKLGAFNVSFTDLTVPLAGIPITITRSYNTLNAEQDGDFGYGWTLAIADAQLDVENLPDAGPGWTSYTPFTDGTHVYLTLPDGTRQGYTFQAQQVFDDELGLTSHYEPYFVPDKGDTATLTVPNADSVALQPNGDGTYYTIEESGVNDYNPADPTYGNAYIVTAPGGLNYTIDATTGLITSIGNRVGNTLTITKDGITSSFGPKVVFERNPHGQITAIIDPDGNTLHYGYNMAGDLVSFTDRLGNVTTFGYSADEPHYLLSIEDPLKRQAVETSYYSDGRVSQMTDAAGNAITYSYDINGRTQQTTDQLGNVTQTDYDPNGNVVEQITPDGVKTLKQYTDTNFPNLVTEEIDVVGQIDSTANGEHNDLTTTYGYDDQGNLTATTDPSKNTTRTVYDQYGDPISAVDAAGNATTNYYDPITGEFSQVIIPDGQVTTFGYDDNGDLTGASNTNGQTLVDNTYDGSGNVTGSTPAAGRQTHYAYDDNGDQIATWYFAGTGTGRVQVLDLTFYDGAGQVISTEHAALPADNSGSTSAVNLSVTVFPASIAQQYIAYSTSTTYDGDGKVITSTSETGLVTENSYDLRGNLIQVRQQSQDSNGRIVWLDTRTVYDAAGQVVAATDQYVEGTTQPITGTLTVYDGDGNVIETDQVHGINIGLVGNGAALQSVLVSPVLTRPLTSAEIAAYEIVSTSSQFDSADRDVTSTDANGLVTDTIYDANGNVIRTGQETIDQSGTPWWLVTDTVYDSLGRVSVTTDPYKAAYTTSANQDPGAALYNVAGISTYATQTIYDSLGREIKSVRLTGVQVSIVNGMSQLTNAGTELWETRTSYDSQGRTAETVAADGEVTDYEYDSLGRQTAMIGAPVPLSEVGLMSQGLALTDASGNSVAVSSSDSLMVRLRSETTYDSATGRVATLTTNIYEVVDVTTGRVYFDRTHGEVTSYQYDAMGNVTRTTFADGISTEATYDALGNKISDTNQLGQTTIYQYDLENRLTTVTLPAVLNPGNNTMTNPVYTYAYDGLGDQTLIQDPEGHQTLFIFNGQGQELSRTLPMGQTETFQYDDQGRQTLHVSFEGVVTQYVYSTQTGLLSTESFFSSMSTYNAYVANPVTAPPQETWNFTYDAFGRQYRVIESGGVNTGTTTYGYDGEGRTTEVTSPQGTITYQYDNLGRKTETIDTTATGSQDTIYTYDLLGRLETVTEDLTPGKTPDNVLTTSYQYDLSGNLTQETLPNGVVDINSYDTMNRLTTKFEYASSNLVSTNELASYVYTLNPDSTDATLVEKFYTPGSTLTDTFAWTYDYLDRLAGETLNSSDSSLNYTASYQYDLDGNETKLTKTVPSNSALNETDTSTFNADDQITQTVSTLGTTTTYGYTGNQQTSQNVVQSNGSYVDTTYSYDLQGNMKTALVNTNGSQELQTYGYDANGVRVSTLDETMSGGEWTQHTMTEYLNDPQNLTGYVQVVRATLTNEVTGQVQVIDYTWGLDSIAQTTTAYTNGNAGTPATLVFGHDGHGSVRMVTALGSGATFAGVQRIFVYNAYGNMVAIFDGSGNNLGDALTPASILTVYLYSDEQTDFLTGLQRDGVRYYNRVMAGFTTGDPISPFALDPHNPQTLNRTLYVHGDPINYNDPAGEDGDLASLEVSEEEGDNVDAMNSQGVSSAAKNALRGAISQVHLIVGFAELPGMKKMIGHSSIYIENIASNGQIGVSFGIGPAAGTSKLWSVLGIVPGNLSIKEESLRDATKGSLDLKVTKLSAAQTFVFYSTITISAEVPYGGLTGLLGVLGDARGLLSDFRTVLNCHTWAVCAAIQALVIHRMPI